MTIWYDNLDDLHDKVCEQMGWKKTGGAYFLKSQWEELVEEYTSYDLDRSENKNELKRIWSEKTGARRDATGVSRVALQKNTHRKKSTKGQFFSYLAAGWEPDESDVLRALGDHLGKDTSRPDHRLRRDIRIAYNIERDDRIDAAEPLTVDDLSTIIQEDPEFDHKEAMKRRLAR